MKLDRIIERLIKKANPTTVQRNSFSYDDRIVPGGVAESWSFSVLSRVPRNSYQIIRVEIRSMGGHNKLKVYLNGAESLCEDVILGSEIEPLREALEKLRRSSMASSRGMLEAVLADPDLRCECGVCGPGIGDETIGCPIHERDREEYDA